VSFELREVALVYPSRSGAVRALDGVTLAIARGERVALLGPSGAGKSSLLKLFNATARPTAGAIRFEGRKLAALAGGELRAVRRRIGTVFQQPSLVPSLTALQNALCGQLGSWSLARSLRALLAAAPSDTREARAALETVGLLDKAAARADELSGGQQQRVAIARVLVQDPEVVLTDEPFASLDPGLTAQLADLLLRVAQGRTLIAALHDVELALAHFPRIVGLRGGRVAFDAKASQVSPRMLQDLYAHEVRGAVG
jgi:phosphonate transport system ATP-binding protein